VDGGHEAADDTELVVEDLGHGSQAVGGAGSVGDDLLAGVGLVIDAVDEHRGGILGRSGHDDLLGTSLEVCGSKLLGEEETGGLDDYVGVKLAPSDVGRILLSEDLDLLAVDDKIVALSVDLATELTVDGVILEHVSEIIGIEEVVDTYNLDLTCEILISCTENHTADTAKSVNTKFYHCVIVYIKKLNEYQVVYLLQNQRKFNKFSMIFHIFVL
jgi:hypothetical protein